MREGPLIILCGGLAKHKRQSFSIECINFLYIRKRGQEAGSGLGKQETGSETGQVSQSHIPHRIAAMHQVSIILIAARAHVHWATSQKST